MGKFMPRLSRMFVLFALIVLFLSGMNVPLVHADGGAPQLAYVAGTPRGVSVVDIAQRRVTGTLPLEGQAAMVLLSLDGAALYAALPTAGRVVVLATKTGKIICTARFPGGQPDLLALSIDASVLYVAGASMTSVYALNPATCVRERIFETRQQIYGLAVAASADVNATPETPNQIWIAGENGLTVFDATGRLFGAVSVDGGPQYLSIPAGFTAYVTTRAGSVVAVDLNTRRVIRTLLSGGKYGQMDYDATTREIYVPDRLNQRLEILAPVTINTAVTPHEPARQFTLDSPPLSVAITNDGQLGFVTLASGLVLMLDIPGRAVITSIRVGGLPRFVITGLYPPDTSPAPARGTSVGSPTTFGSMFPILGAVLVMAVCGMAGLFWFFRRRARK